MSLDAGCTTAALSRFKLPWPPCVPLALAPPAAALAPGDAVAVAVAAAVAEALTAGTSAATTAAAATAAGTAAVPAAFRGVG